MTVQTDRALHKWQSNQWTLANYGERRGIIFMGGLSNNISFLLKNKFILVFLYYIYKKKSFLNFCLTKRAQKG